MNLKIMLGRALVVVKNARDGEALMFCSEVEVR